MLLKYQVLYFCPADGRTIKFTFPNAAATTVLAWGLINHEAGYQAAGEGKICHEMNKFFPYL
jgi:hypothetical protein